MGNDDCGGPMRHRPQPGQQRRFAIYVATADNPMGPFADMNPNVSCAAVMGDGM